MQVSSTSQTTSTTGTQSTSDKSSTTLDYDAFLHLLVAQLKNQDPTKPMDSAQYMSQLASFSNVEQGVKMNAKLDALLTTASLSQAEALVGRTISLTDGSASGVVKAVHVYSDGTVAELENGDKIIVGPGVSVS